MNGPAFVRPRRVAHPALRLIVLPHAGGSAAAYFPLARLLPEDWDVLLLDLPGRGRRHALPPLEDIGELLAVVAADVLPWAEGPPLALFGHSFGAMVAYETGRVLEAAGVCPAWVGLSGRGAPGRPGADPPNWSELPEPELLDRLDEMGGLDPRVAALPELRERFLRLIRSDLRALESYRPASGRTPTAAPLTAFGGTADALAPLPALAAWQEETRARFRLRTYPGGHFHFLGDPFARFATDVTEEARLAAVPDFA